MGQLNTITNYITQLLTQHVGQFTYLGQSMFLSFATIMIVWFGAKSALGSDRAGGFHFGNFASLIMMIAFGYAMTQYYDTPIPGFGRSFYHLIIDQTEYLSNLLAGTQLQNASNAIANYQGQIQSPGLTDVSGSIAYILDETILALWQAVAIIITAYGFVAQAICILVGPIFIPFFIVPKLEWLFWGWLRCFLQYAFYEVIAAAVVYIIGNLIIGVLTLQGTGNISTLQLIGWFPVLLITFVSSIYVLLKVPALTNHIFSGTAGGSSAGILDAIPAAATAVAKEL